MTDAERLRERMVAAVQEPYPDDLFIPPPDIWNDLHEWAKARGTTLDAISADTVRKLVGVHAMGRICRAIVEEFGLVRDDPYLRQHKQAHDLIHAILDVAEGK